MSYGGQNSDFFLDVSRGLVSGMSTFTKFGRNDAVTALEDVWGFGGIWTPPTSAGTISFASSSSADAAAGTGARTITITGLDASFVEVTETISLSGTTPVATANQYMIVHRVLVATAGTGNTNAGNITGTSTGGGTPVLAYVAAGRAQTTSSIFQVPAGKTAYMMELFVAGQSATATALLDVALFIKPFGGVFNLKADFPLSMTATSMIVRDFASAPRKYTEKSIIKFQATPTAGSWDVTARYDLILVNN